MKSRKIIIFLSLLLCAGALGGYFSSLTTADGEVVGILDGDTIEVMQGGSAVRVRLDGIDCPEKKQAFGRRARQFTSRMAFGKQVQIIEKGKDRYGRTLAEVILPDGKSLNQELVREGYAWWYWKYSDDEELRSLQAQAREAKRGLWSDPRAIPPWTFRQGGVTWSEDNPDEVLADGGNAVFVTRTGSAYHRDDCRYLESSKVPMALSEAQGRGYEPCKVCEPQEKL